MHAKRHVLKVVTLGLVLAAGTAGCTSVDGGAWAPPTQQVETPARPYDPPEEDEFVYTPPPAARVKWRCSYSPTYNYDWHDDVVCSNGTDSTRPYLREWDDYVTEAEIMKSARDYEDELNS